MTTTTHVNVSYPIFGLLGIAFIVLKLLDVITWAWIWVLAPFWMPFALMLCIALLIGSIIGIYYLGKFLVQFLHTVYFNFKHRNR